MRPVLFEESPFCRIDPLGQYLRQIIRCRLDCFDLLVQIEHHFEVVRRTDPFAGAVLQVENIGNPERRQHGKSPLAQARSSRHIGFIPQQRASGGGGAQQVLHDLEAVAPVTDQNSWM